MRPKSIVRFEILIFVLLGCSFLMAALMWDQTIAQFRATPGADRLGDGFPVMLLVASLVIGTAITLMLWYFIARRGSQVAKWIYVLLFVYAVLMQFTAIAGGAIPAGIAGLLSTATTLIQAVAVWMLFQPDAKEWFAAKAPAVPSEPGV